MKASAIITLALVLGMGIWTPAQAEDKSFLVPSITVIGTGKVTARPDMAELQVGVITQADAAAKALKENSQAMTKLLHTLAERGIAEKDIQTANLSVVPQYRKAKPGEPAPEITGYQVTNEVRIKVRKLDSLGTLLDEVVNQGANRMYGIRFSTADPAPHQDAARRQAMTDAYHKAALYAREAGLKCGRVLLIQEQTPHLPRPEFVGLARGAAAASVPVAPGVQEFTASITVTYAIDGVKVTGTH